VYFWFILVSEGIEDETETVDMPDGCHQGNRGHSLGYPQTKYPAEEKIRIVVDGFRCEETIAELYRREGIAQSIYHKWLLAFMEAGKRRLAGETLRATSTGEVTTLRQKTCELTIIVTEQTLKNRIRPDNHFFPTDLEAQIEAIVDHYKHQRYHESINNLTPADVHFGRGQATLKQRARIMLKTMENRRLQYRKYAA
jgi:transposase-like protein